MKTLTEAAESLGAKWPSILFGVILPNLRVAIVSSAFLTFATVIGEFTMASLLDRRPSAPTCSSSAPTGPMSLRPWR